LDWEVLLMKSSALINRQGHGSVGFRIGGQTWFGVLLLACSAAGSWHASSVQGQSSNLVGPPSFGGGAAQTAQYNSEWVESSSPIPGGGVVATTHFPSNGNTLTTIREPAPGMATAPMQPTGSVMPTAATMQAAPATPNYAAIPTGTGGYMVPTVQYVPMNSAAPAPYQVSAAYNPATCSTCQTPMMTQPTAYQQGFVPQPYASQPPMLPPTAGGVYGPMPGPTAPGMYAQPTAMAPPPAAPTNQGGWRPLIPRSMPAGTYLSQGWLGQPKAYVTSQPFRNVIRYMLVP